MDLEHSCLSCRYCKDFMCVQSDIPQYVNNGCCEHWWPKNCNEDGKYEPLDQPKSKTIHIYKQIKVILADNHKSFEEQVNEKLKEDWELVDFKINEKYRYLLAIVSKDFEEEV